MAHSPRPLSVCAQVRDMDAVSHHQVNKIQEWLMDAEACPTEWDERARDSNRVWTSMC